MGAPRAIANAGATMPAHGAPNTRPFILTETFILGRGFRIFGEPNQKNEAPTWASISLGKSSSKRKIFCHRCLQSADFLRALAKPKLHVMGKRPNVGRWFREGNLSANRADKHEVTSPSSALSPDPGKPPHKPGTQFVARQTILGLDQSVYGYELLFRNGVEDFFGGTDLDAASRSTLNTSLLMGIDVLCDGRRAFINCTRDVLLKDYITLLPPSQVVIEVLETVPADDLVVAACLRMKKAGYLIALDDFSTKDPRQDIAPLADIIKVDLRATSAGEAAAMVNQYGRAGCRMLAEKVETREEFESAKKSGFVYFQGYFFRRPELLTAHEIPANRMNYIRSEEHTSELQSQF